MADPKTTALLDAERVSVRISGASLLSDVSLSARAGEVLCVLGPNGAGKSTLLRALVGLQPHEGSVRLDGRAVGELPPRERACRLAYVPQHTALRSALPVREVVALGRYAHRGAFGRFDRGDEQAIDHALERCDVHRLQERPFTQLSLGEQRRVLIARALASLAPSAGTTGGRVLCLDEPTAALDVQHVLRVHALLRELATEGLAVISVLHPLDDALRHADRALLLRDGRTAASGPVAEVVTEAIVREVYGVQMLAGQALGFRLPGAAP